MAKPKPGETPIHVESLYGAQQRRGLVKLVVGETETFMDPMKAREVAMYLIEAAESATTDECVMRLGAELGDDVAVLLLRALRAERNKQRGTPTHSA